MEKEENRKWFCQAARLVSSAAIHVSETRDRIGEFSEDECAETLRYAVTAAQRAQEFIDAGASHAEASRAQKHRGRRPSWTRFAGSWKH